MKATVVVRVTAKARKQLRRLKKLKVTLSVTATDAAGNAATSARSLTLKR